MLQLVDPQGRRLYTWQNVFESMERANEYKEYMKDGLRAGYDFRIVEVVDPVHTEEPK